MVIGYVTCCVKLTTWFVLRWKKSHPNLRERLLTNLHTTEPLMLWSCGEVSIIKTGFTINKNNGPKWVPCTCRSPIWNARPLQPQLDFLPKICWNMLNKNVFHSDESHDGIRCWESEPLFCPNMFRKWSNASNPRNSWCHDGPFFCCEGKTPRSPPWVKLWRCDWGLCECCSEIQKYQLAIEWKFWYTLLCHTVCQPNMALHLTTFWPRAPLWWVGELQEADPTEYQVHKIGEFIHNPRLVLHFSWAALKLLQNNIFEKKQHEEDNNHNHNNSKNNKNKNNNKNNNKKKNNIIQKQTEENNANKNNNKNIFQQIPSKNKNKNKNKNNNNNKRKKNTTTTTTTATITLW